VTTARIQGGTPKPRMYRRQPTFEISPSHARDLLVAAWQAIHAIERRDYQEAQRVLHAAIEPAEEDLCQQSRIDGATRLREPA
jgi:hypothetical protein